MYNSGTVITITLLLYNRVIISQSEGSFLMEQMIANNRENILEKFFAELKIHLAETDARDVTVIGASDDQLRLSEPLLEDFPYIVGTNVTGICTAKEFFPNAVVIHFLASLNDEYLKMVFQDLGRCAKRKIYLIFEGRSPMNSDDVRSVPERVVAFGRKENPPLFVHHVEGEYSLKAYGYGKANNCSGKVKLITEWIPGDGVNKLHVSFEQLGPFPGCPLKIAALDNPPWMELEERATSGARIKGGFEGKIISDFTKRFDYAPVVRGFSVSDSITSVMAEAIISSCAAGNTSIGIGQIRPSEGVISRVAISNPYSAECVVWCVPRITYRKSGILDSEFSSDSWIFAGLTFVTILAIEWVVRNTRHLNRGIVGKSDCSRIILDIVGTALGNPIAYEPLSIGSKALLIIYICYSLVMTTAYKTSLPSLLTLGNIASTIVDVEGIIKANLTTGGDVFRLAILEDQRNESKWVPELLKRYVIETNTSKALRRVSIDQDFAYLTSGSNLAYFKALFEKRGEQILVDILDGCVLSYRNVAVTPYGSVSVSEKLDTYLQRLFQSGIMAHWKRTVWSLNGEDFKLTGSSGILHTREELAKFTRGAIFHILRLYLTVMALCVLAFIGELIVHKLRSRSRNRRLDNLIVFKTNPLPLNPTNQSLRSANE